MPSRRIPNRIDGTGPFCFVSWTPRDKMVMTRHEGYNWGPTNYENQGPAQVEKITWQVVPEAATRTVAMLTGQGDVSPYVPYIGVDKPRQARFHRIDVPAGYLHVTPRTKQKPGENRAFFLASLPHQLNGK